MPVDSKGKTNAKLETRFFDALRRGVGEAVLLLKDHPHVDFDKSILKACRRNLLYDPQCEPSREDYLYEIVQLAKHPEAIQSAVLQSLRRAKKDNRNTWQMLHLARVFAENGNERAREVLYQRVELGLREDYEPVDGDLVKLDGIKGLKFVAEIMGKMLLKNKDEFSWECECEINDYKEKYSRPDPRKELEKEAKTNPYIRKYLETMDQNSREERKRRRHKNTYETVQTQIDQGKRSVFTYGIKKSELLRLAKDLIQETEIKKIKGYLKAFANPSILHSIADGRAKRLSFVRRALEPLR